MAVTPDFVPPEQLLALGWRASCSSWLASLKADSAVWPGGAGHSQVQCRGEGWSALPWRLPQTRAWKLVHCSVGQLEPHHYARDFQHGNKRNVYIARRHNGSMLYAKTACDFQHDGWWISTVHTVGCSVHGCSMLACTSSDTAPSKHASTKLQH